MQDRQNTEKVDDYCSLNVVHPGGVCKIVVDYGFTDQSKSLDTLHVGKL